MTPAIFSPSATTHAPVSVARSIDRGGLVLRRERQRVGEDQAPFGVGVEHFDGLAVADAQHVAGTDRVTARHVLDERHVAVHALLHAERLQRRHRRDHRRATRHVALHRLHARAGLQRQATGVEHHALADERERLPAAPGGEYVSLRKRGPWSEPWPTPSTPPSFNAFSCATSMHGDGDAGAAQQLARLGRELGRRLLLRRPVDHVARPRHRVGDHRAALERGLHARAARADDRRPSRAWWASPSAGTRGTGTRRAPCPSASACAASTRSSAGAASSTVVATDVTLARALARWRRRRGARRRA